MAIMVNRRQASVMVAASMATVLIIILAISRLPAGMWSFNAPAATDVNGSSDTPARVSSQHVFAVTIDPGMDRGVAHDVKASVFDSNGSICPGTSFSWNEDGTGMMILPPADGYDPGDYTLEVTGLNGSIDGKTVNGDTAMAFSVFTLPAGSKQVGVDASSNEASFKAAMGVNAGPEEAAAAYRDSGVEYVRMHDAGCHNDYQEYTNFYDAGSNTFNPDFDPNNTSCYDWLEVDNDVKSIVDNEMQPFFRLGVSWPREGIPVQPPFDPGGKSFSKFAELGRHTLMHYNQGWDDGYYYGIKYWEIWNEPDGRFWKGSARDFYRLYEATATSLKKQDQSILVGGPGSTPGAAVARKPEYCGDFLAYCQQKSLPLDFYSWHIYGVFNPYLVKSHAEYIRSEMDQAGYTEAQSIISEINIELGQSGDKDLNSALGAAYVASVMMTVQDSPVDMVLWYRGNKFMNLFEDDVNGQASYKWNGLGFKAVNTVLQNSTVRLECTGNETTDEDNGKESNNFMVLAGRSDKQNDVYIAISNYYSNNKDVFVTVKGLDSGGLYEVTCCRVQRPDSKWAESSEVLQADDSQINVSLAGLADPAVCLIKVSRL